MLSCSLIRPVYPYPSLPHWLWCTHTVATVPLRQPWRNYLDKSCDHRWVIICTHTHKKKKSCAHSVGNAVCILWYLYTNSVPDSLCCSSQPFCFLLIFSWAYCQKSAWELCRRFQNPNSCSTPNISFYWMLIQNALHNTSFQRFPRWCSIGTEVFPWNIRVDSSSPCLAGAWGTLQCKIYNCQRNILQSSDWFDYLTRCVLTAVLRTWYLW